MIFVDTNVVSETMRAEPDARVSAWLERHDAELALSTVVIAEIAFGIERIVPNSGPAASKCDYRLCAGGSPTGSSR